MRTSDIAIRLYTFARYEPLILAPVNILDNACIVQNELGPTASERQVSPSCNHQIVAVIRYDQCKVSDRCAAALPLIGMCLLLHYIARVQIGDSRVTKAYKAK